MNDNNLTGPSLHTFTSPTYLSAHPNHHSEYCHLISVK